MTKGRITKGLLLTTLFSGLAVLFFFLTFMTTNLVQAGVNELVFGLPPVALSEFTKMETIGGAFQNAFWNTWWPGLKTRGKEYFNFFNHLFDSAWWVSGSFINSLTFYGFALVIAVYLLYVLYTLIFGLFVYKKKKSSLFNIIWFAIPTFCISFLIVGFHGAIYGNEAYQIAGGGNATTGPLFLLLKNILAVSKDGTLGMGTKVKAWTLVVSLIILFIMLIPLLWQAIANVYVGIPLYLHQHKYDYLEKAERKRRQQFYKNHGYENIANQQTEKGKNGKKGKNKKDQNAYESNNPYVQQQQAAMGYTGANPNPYMNQYGYGPYPYGAQVNTIPTGGNTVHTGNNAPLIVQYITNGRDENQLKSNQIDENTTSIYGTSRARATAPQPAPVTPAPTTTNESLTKDDIKSAVYDILKENNLITPEVALEATKDIQESRTIEDDYDVLTLDDLKELIKDSVQDLLPKAEEKPVDEVKPVEETKPVEEIRTHLDETLTEETKIQEEPKVIAPVQKEEKIIPPIVVAIPTKIEEEVEELPLPEIPEEEEETIDEEELRNLISSQLQEALKSIKVEEKETVQEVPVYIKEVEKPQQIIKEVIKEVPTVKEIIKEVHIPVEKTVEVVKEVAAPVEEATEPVKRPLIPQPEIRGKEKEVKKVEAVKLNFQEKLLTSGTDLVLAYNSLKNLLMSYGLKDRVSNSGDTFRLHKKTYCKITMGGSHLKIYLALDPKNYLNTAIPVGDASFKELYRDIPLVFRVKSDSSLQRARDLIVDCMNTQNLSQVSEEGQIDYASQLKNK